MTQKPFLLLRSVANPDGSPVCWAGTTAAGHAFLLGNLWSSDYAVESVAVWFNDQGVVKEVRQLTPDAHFRQEQPDAPEQLPPAELVSRWREALGLREAAITVQPFQLPTHRIAVVAGPPDVPAGKPHHSLWWQREYWLDETGKVVALGREDPDRCPSDVLIQLRLSEPEPTEAERTACQQLAEIMNHFIAISAFGRFAGPEWGRGVATFSVLGLIGRQWPTIADLVHVWLGEQGMLERAREILRSHYRYADGREEIACQVLWPKGFHGEVSLTSW